MFGLPANTEVGTQLPKKSIYAKFTMNTAEREKFDADISRIVIANAVDGRHLAEGEKVKSFYVLSVQLKQKDYDPKNILTLVKLINQNILFALVYEEQVQFAIHHTKLITSSWQSTAEANISLSGLDLDAVWENIVKSVGNIDVTEGNTLTEQIKVEDARVKITAQIASLQKKLNSEKQFNRQIEINAQIKTLRKQLMELK